MFGFDFFTFFILFNTIKFIKGDPCSFNANCSCDNSVCYQCNVFCDNFDEFPIFNITSPTGFINFTVRGKYEHVPAYAFYNVQPENHILIRDPNAPYAPISFEDTSFFRNVPSLGWYNYFFFGFKAMKYIPKLGSYGRGMNLLIYNGSFPVLSSNFFENLTAGIQLEAAIEYCEIEKIEMGALDGLMMTVGSPFNLSLAHNRLTEFPIALTHSETISQVGLRTLDLSYNLIEKLSQWPNNASGIKQNCLFLNNNNIKILQYGAFKNKMEDKCVNEMTTRVLDLSNNPIEEIELGAFTPVWLSQLELNNLPKLTYIDLGITNGMTTFSLVLSNCPNFRSIIIDDVNQVAVNLTTVRIGPGTDLRNVDSQFQFWLSRSPNNVLDISDNYQINCLAQISWMATFALCSSPPQIITNNAYCTFTKQPLSQYLKIFQPC